MNNVTNEQWEGQQANADSHKLSARAHSSPGWLSSFQAFYILWMKVCSAFSWRYALALGLGCLREVRRRIIAQKPSVRHYTLLGLLHAHFPVHVQCMYEYAYCYRERKTGALELSLTLCLRLLELLRHTKWKIAVTLAQPQPRKSNSKQK